LLDCLRGSFEYFGGVPSEVLFDNMKDGGSGRDLAAGTIQWNERFKDFSGYYGFRPRLTWPYRAQTKGKVERSIGYVRQDLRAYRI
jgi:transposase